MAPATVIPRHGPLERSRTLDELSARATLREQIARLERRLAHAGWELWNARVFEPVTSASGDRGGARLLTFAELEAARDRLVDQVHAIEQLVRQSEGSQARARSRLEAMQADPAAHRYEVLRHSELGEPGCGAYHVLPRFGLLGMLFGWWCVKLSSGCPLSMPYPNRYYSSKPRSGWGSHATVELVVTIIVVVVVIATILIFLLVFHDIPLRGGEPT
jgi:hypothetical protein